MIEERLSVAEIAERFNVDQISTFVLIRKQGSRIVHYAELVGPRATVTRTLCGVKADPLDVVSHPRQRIRMNCERCGPAFRDRSSLRR